MDFLKHIARLINYDYWSSQVYGAVLSNMAAVDVDGIQSHASDHEGLRACKSRPALGAVHSRGA